MSRPPVCHYYQAGHCRNGDLCPFTHPTVRCREFCSSGWCPYGFNCHFWHDPSHANASNPRERKPCHFFANGQCKYGDKCSFSHDLKWEEEPTRTLSEYKASKRPTNLSSSNRSASSYKLSSNTLPSKLATSLSGNIGSPLGDIPASTRAPVSRPDSHLVSGGTNKSEICRLQHLEINRLLKTYKSDKLREVDSSGDGRLFFLRFSSTDPDWAYDVREIVLSIHIVRMYPVDPLKITVLAKDYLPDTLVESLNLSIKSWISFKHKQVRQSNRTEIYLRSFLHWLDRNLENLFTQGLRKYKAELFGEENSTGDEPVRQETDAETCLNPPADLHNSDVDGCDAVNDADVAQTDEVQCNASDHSSPDHSHCVSSSHSRTASESTKSSTIDPFETIPGEWVEPVPPKPSSPEAEEIDRSLLDKLLKPSEETTSSQRSASQKLILNDLRLFGKTGTVLQRRLTVNLHCTRCRLAFTWIFTLHHNPVFEKDSTFPTDLRSVPPHTSTCARCRQPMELVFQAAIMHSFSNTVGSFHLDGCVADDIPPKLSEFVLTCIECNKHVKLNGVEGGGRVGKRCTTCHSLVGIEFDGYRLEMVKGVGENVINVTRPGANNIPAPSRKVRHAINKAQNQLIQDGMPLPDLGTCKHYRKSHRWLRFPCCGRAEPCDVCHDQSAVDNHEMEMATRMICGFCAKEQPFSNTKPCVRCGKHLSGSHSAHWEGGKGCRNKITMSRKDSKKYSQLNKTVSRGKANS